MSVDASSPGVAPFRVARFGLPLMLSFVLLGCIVIFGAYGYLQQRLHGDIVTGLRTVGQGGPAWGLYICFDVMFVGFAFSGISLSALTRIFRIHTLWPVTRMAEVLAVIALMMAGVCVIADLGRPLHGLINLPLYARTASPFFGTFTLVIGAGLSASLIYLFLDGRVDAAWWAKHSGARARLFRFSATGFRNTVEEHHRRRLVSFGLSLVLLPLMLISFSTLGFVFGIQGGRPGWFGALQAPSFVILAAISGLGLLLAVAACVRSMLHLQECISERVFLWLGSALGVLTMTYLYLLCVDALTSRYASSSAQAAVALELTQGKFAPLFWLMVAGFVLPAILLVDCGLRRKPSIALAAVCGVLVNVAAVLNRFLVVVPSQTNGQLLPWPDGSYAPTWVELSVIAGVLALGTLMFLIYLQIFPIVPLQALGISTPVQAPAEGHTRRRLRLCATWFTLLFGMALAAVGLALSARIGTQPQGDPLLPGSPVMFLAGVVCMLASALVFELFPSAKSTAP